MPGWKPERPAICSQIDLKLHCQHPSRLRAATHRRMAQSFMHPSSDSGPSKREPEHLSLSTSCRKRSATENSFKKAILFAL